MQQGKGSDAKILGQPNTPQRIMKYLWSSFSILPLDRGVCQNNNQYGVDGMLC